MSDQHVIITITSNPELLLQYIKPVQFNANPNYSHAINPAFTKLCLRGLLIPLCGHWHDIQSSKSATIVPTLYLNRVAHTHHSLPHSHLNMHVHMVRTQMLQSTIVRGVKHSQNVVSIVSRLLCYHFTTLTFGSDSLSWTSAGWSWTSWSMCVWSVCADLSVNLTFCLLSASYVSYSWRLCTSLTVVKEKHVTMDTVLQWKQAA